MFVEDARHHSPIREAFLRAGQWLGYGIVDQNAGSQAGFAPFQFNIYKGGKEMIQKLSLPIHSGLTSESAFWSIGLFIRSGHGLG